MIRRELSYGEEEKNCIDCEYKVLSNSESIMYCTKFSKYCVDVDVCKKKNK